MLYNQEDLSSNPQYEHKNLNVSEYAEIYNIYISCVCMRVRVCTYVMLLVWSEDTLWESVVSFNM